MTVQHEQSTHSESHLWTETEVKHKRPWVTRGNLAPKLTKRVGEGDTLVEDVEKAT